MTQTRLGGVADLSSWTVKMLKIKYFLCLMPSVKTSDYIRGILMSDMESPYTKLWKTLKTQFPSGNILSEIHFTHILFKVKTVSQSVAKFELFHLKVWFTANFAF